VDPAAQKVNVPTLQAQHLSKAEVASGPQLHGDPPRLRDCLGEGIDLGNRQHRTFGGSLLRRTPHDAGISDDELVGDSTRQSVGGPDTKRSRYKQIGCSFAQEWAEDGN
jgi:hypothetical protein